MKLVLNKEYAGRHLFVTLLMVGLCCWFGYDGFIRYPATPAAELYASIEGSEPPEQMTDEQLEAFKKQKTQTQYGFTALTFLAALVVDAASADALLSKIGSAYDGDPLVLTQIAAVTQWVMLPDPWYCLFWDGEHAAGRKVWVKALVATAEETEDTYVKMFALDQLRWCGCDCPCLVARLRKMAEKSNDKGVMDFTEVVVRELQKKSIGLPDAACENAKPVMTAGVPGYSDTVEEGFVSLFNGKDLSGWYGSKKYDVETIEVKLNNGTVVKQPVIACFPNRKVEKDCGNLLTEKEYRNFILRFEFLMPENGNNGLGIRVPNENVDAAYEGMCELQLLDDGLRIGVVAHARPGLAGGGLHEAVGILDEKAPVLLVDEVDPEVELDALRARGPPRNGNRIHRRERPVERRIRGVALGLRDPALRPRRNHGTVGRREPLAVREPLRRIPRDAQSRDTPEDAVDAARLRGVHETRDVLRGHPLPAEPDFVERVDCHHDSLRRRRYRQRQQQRRQKQRFVQFHFSHPLMLDFKFVVSAGVQTVRAIHRRNQQPPPLATDGEDVLAQRLRPATGAAEPQLTDVKIRVNAPIRLDRRAKPLLSAPMSRARSTAASSGSDAWRYCIAPDRTNLPHISPSANCGRPRRKNSAKAWYGTFPLCQWTMELSTSAFSPPVSFTAPGGSGERTSRAANAGAPHKARGSRKATFIGQRLIPPPPPSSRCRAARSALRMRRTAAASAARRACGTTRSQGR